MHAHTHAHAHTLVADAVQLMPVSEPCKTRRRIATVTYDGGRLLITARDQLARPARGSLSKSAKGPERIVNYIGGRCDERCPGGSAGTLEKRKI